MRAIAYTLLALSGGAGGSGVRPGEEEKGDSLARRFSLQAADEVAGRKAADLKIIPARSRWWSTSPASGFHAQYTGLEKLHEELKDKNFSILGFPSNDFGSQDPARRRRSRSFCSTKYSVTFPLSRRS